ncbi:MAG: aldose epimerase family protein [Oscillospiraceae bacterium]
MEKACFGKDKNGNEIFRYTIADGDNSLSVLNYGATIQSLKVKNKQGKLVDVVLGFDNLSQYEKEEGRTYFGAVCGRVANRIKGGHFFVDAVEYSLAQNDKGNCLHGGADGFDKQFFDLTDAGDNYMVFSYLSDDGEEGFPGCLGLSVRYTFSRGLLLIEYSAATTKTCPVSITNHSYFNLDGKGDIKAHSLQLNSKFYMEVEDDGCASGRVLPTHGTDFDFSKQTVLGQRISAQKAKRPTIKGLDHYFFCDNGITDYRRFGTVSNEEGSLKLDIFTNQTGAQIYTGNYIPSMVGKSVELYENSGICFETQTPPGSLEFSHLPSMLLNKEGSYYHKTAFRFYF